MLSKLKRRLRSSSKQTSRMELEKLDSRLLLSATSMVPDVYADGDNLSDFVRDGYGLPDVFHSDPATWNLNYSDGLTLPDAIEASSTHDDLAGILGGTDLSQGNNDYGPLLSSSAYTLYLDFDGARVYSRPSDFWLGSSYVDVPAFSLDSFGWGGREAESISTIAAMVQEDYAAYNVNVTLREPVSGSYTTLYVGGDNSWFRAGSSVIGVATYDIGNRMESNYGFAFTEELGVYKNYSNGSLNNFSEYIANLVTHEAAHTFGSNHVSDTTAIMNPYLPISPRVSSFGGDSSQDTQLLLGSNIGYAHGRDDYGDGFSNAEPISLQGVTAGILETRDDQDTFSFTASFSGPLSIDLDTSIYGNLDSYLKVYNTGSRGLVGQNDDHGGETDSYVTVNVVSGEQYTIEVSSASGDSSGTYSLGFVFPDAEPAISITDQSGPSDDRSIDFGTLKSGTYTTSEFMISNDGLANLTISRLSSSSPFELNIVSAPGNRSDDLVIAPGETQTVTVLFDPETAGTYSGAVVIVSNDEDSPELTLDLVGTMASPQPEMSVNAVVATDGDYVLDFGNITRNTTGFETVSLANTGLVDLLISDVTISGPFEFTSGQVGPESIAPGESIALTVQVRGQVREQVTGRINIITNDPDEPEATIDLTAQITAGVLTVNESCQVTDDNQIDFGIVYQGERVQKTITLVNTGDDILTINDLSMDPVFTMEVGHGREFGIDGIQLDVGDAVEIFVGYSPEATGEVHGELVITSDDSEAGVTMVDLQATGDDNPLEIIEADGIGDGLVDAGRLRVGEFYIIDLWTLANHGNEPVAISLDLGEPSEFQLVGSEYIVIPAGGDYDVQLVLDTEQALAINDTITLTADNYYHSSDTLRVCAEPFALVGGRDKYTFIDHDGDEVRISLVGEGTAEVTLGAAGQPDIELIHLRGGAEPGKLNIKVKGDGKTQLGAVTGTADLKYFNASGVDLVGEGIDIDGTIDCLRLSGILHDADMSYETEKPAVIRVGHVGVDSTIDIDGPLNRVVINQFDDGLLRSTQINRVQIGQMAGDIEVTDGDLNTLKINQGGYDGHVDVNGHLASLTVKSGNLTGQINVADDIGRLLLPHGDIDGEIKSGKRIGLIKAMNLNQARIYAQTQIDKIFISDDMKDSMISIGYDVDLPMDGQSATAVLPMNTQMGLLNIRGTFESSTIAVGVAPGSDGTLIHGVAHTSSGSIGRVNISNLNTDNQDNPFGLVARDSLGKLRINRQVISSDYKSDDFYATVIKN
ncbi:MAG: choice-of-anchor D domain-containing protein [Phycisphaerae bacterium]|nr:choice-of-anchor D domain-containing protein [Phycisphaerae bacterium]